jgi:hypothetical protein
VSPLIPDLIGRFTYFLAGFIRRLVYLLPAVSAGPGLLQTASPTTSRIEIPVDLKFSRTFVLLPFPGSAENNSAIDRRIK